MAFMRAGPGVALKVVGRAQMPVPCNTRNFVVGVVVVITMLVIYPIKRAGRFSVVANITIVSNPDTISSYKTTRSIPVSVC